MMLLVAAIAMSHADEGTALTLLFYNHHMLALFVCRVEGVPHLALIISMFRR